MEDEKNSFSNTNKSPPKKQSKDKKNYTGVEKNGQKTSRKLENVEPKVVGEVVGEVFGAKSQSPKLQQNRKQYLPSWPKFDDGHTSVPGRGMQDSSLFDFLSAPHGSQLGANNCDVASQAPFNIDKFLQQLFEPLPPVTLPMPTMPLNTTPFETTMGVGSHPDHSRPNTPYGSEKDLADLMIDQLQGSPASGYSSPVSSMSLPPIGYPVYEDMSLFAIRSSELLPNFNNENYPVDLLIDLPQDIKLAESVYCPGTKEAECSQVST